MVRLARKISMQFWMSNYRCFAQMERTYAHLFETP
jgi:hypothetical protein